MVSLAGASQPFVVITEARVRSWAQLVPFAGHATRSFVQAQATEGCLGQSMFLRGPLRWCTITAWQSDAAMRAYVRSGAHLEAMRATKDLVAATRFARLPHVPGTWPTVLMAREALDASISPKPGEAVPTTG